MLKFAFYADNPAAARLLLEQDMQIDWRDEKEFTPLMSACRIPRSPWEVQDLLGPLPPETIVEAEALIRWLVASGADLNATRLTGRTMTTALHWAVPGCSEAIIDFSIASGARVDWPEDSEPVVVGAALGNNTAALRALLKRGASLNRPSVQRRAEGRTALGLLLLDRSNGNDMAEAIAFLQTAGAKEWPE